MMRPEGAPAPGGAVSLVPGAGADHTELTPDVYGRDLVVELPILKRLADIDARIVFNLDSGDMQPSDWLVIAREVHGALSSGEYDGIVVVHGTDTMAYTASALALLLGPLPR